MVEKFSLPFEFEYAKLGCRSSHAWGLFNAYRNYLSSIFDGEKRFNNITPESDTYHVSIFRDGQALIFHYRQSPNVGDEHNFSIVIQQNPSHKSLVDVFTDFGIIQTFNEDELDKIRRTPTKMEEILKEKRELLN